MSLMLLMEPFLPGSWLSCAVLRPSGFLARDVGAAQDREEMYPWCFLHYKGTHILKLPPTKNLRAILRGRRTVLRDAGCDIGIRDSIRDSILTIVGVWMRLFFSEFSSSNNSRSMCPFYKCGSIMEGQRAWTSWTRWRACEGWGAAAPRQCPMYLAPAYSLQLTASSITVPGGLRAFGHSGLWVTKTLD